jgi:hypothetical protein
MSTIKLFGTTFDVTYTTKAGAVVFENEAVRGHVYNGIAYLAGGCEALGRIVEGREDSVYIVGVEERELGGYAQLYINV